MRATKVDVWLWSWMAIVAVVGIGSYAIGHAAVGALIAWLLAVVAVGSLFLFRSRFE